MNYAIEQRLRLVDFLLAQYGTVNREALMDFYGISAQQASADFKQYMEIAPGNMAYNASLKCYIRVETFKRKW